MTDICGEVDINRRDVSFFTVYYLYFLSFDFSYKVLLFAFRKKSRHYTFQQQIQYPESGSVLFKEVNAIKT